MTGRNFSENAADTALSGKLGIRALCRRCCEQALAAYAGHAALDTGKTAAAEEPSSFHSRTVVRTGSVYAREFLDTFSADAAAFGLRVAMSAQRRPCYRGEDIVPSFYLPGTPQAECEKKRTPVRNVQEAEEHMLRLLSLLFQAVGRQGVFQKETETDVRLLALRVHAPAAVTGLGLCRVLIGKTQKELAALLGISVKAYRLREQGRMPLSEKMAADICRLAGCRRQVLLPDGDVGWDAAEAVWEVLSPEVRRWIAVLAALFLHMLCGADRSVTESTGQTKQ